jgi:hypothetical protein
VNSLRGDNVLEYYLIDIAGNVATNTISYFQYTSLNVEDLNDGHIKQYPNPFNNSATIEYAFNIPENILILIYDLTGRVIESISKNNTQIGTLQFGRSYSPGTYYYWIFTENGYSSNGKLIKVH